MLDCSMAHVMRSFFPRRVYDRLENGQSVSRILFESHVLPHLGLTASPRVGRAVAGIHSAGFVTA